MERIVRAGRDAPRDPPQAPGRNDPDRKVSGHPRAPGRTCRRAGRQHREELAQTVTTELAKWMAVARSAGIKPE